ncbi:AAA ATPase domain-containing protein [Heterostelium album PN500]|uniref:Peroxisomal ATPase PEX6 n=1 Tax=Heterostelium pallidum (strain ATCC 26659 / Pp 5 / PN500) TaxID=670386 RepID=D3BKR2_HETP5|nr:AAA ATPase domain-containing protein [Heterostelium album PN500]EFA78492.1 AAA ATPase domain-containing protein [Heterostelium album PN500]|eukprot:XP_020430616.1 AAA ATPase domain-containing protein [Heterostelium album PN500]
MYFDGLERVKSFIKPNKLLFDPPKKLDIFQLSMTTVIALSVLIICKFYLEYNITKSDIQIYFTQISLSCSGSTFIGLRFYTLVTRMFEWYQVVLLSDEQYIARYGNDRDSNNTLFNIIIDVNSLGDEQQQHQLYQKNYIFIYKLDRFNQFRYLNSNINDGSSYNVDRLKYLCYQPGKQELLSTFRVASTATSTTAATPTKTTTNRLPRAYCSASYAKRFNFKKDDIIHLKTVSISSVALERVVLLANDLQSFQSVITTADQHNNNNNNNSNNKNNNNYKADQMFKNYLISNSILFNQDARLSLGHNNQSVSFEIMECYPLLQGSISSNTTIIIVGPDQQSALNLERKLNRLEIGSSPSSPAASSNSSNSSSSSSYLSNTNLRVSNFIIHPLSQSMISPSSLNLESSTTSSSSSVFSSSVISSSQINSSLFHFTPNSNRILLNNTVQIRQLKTIPSNIYLPLIDPNYDYLYDAIVTLSTLKQYGLFHGATIKLKSLINHKYIVIKIFSIMNNNSNNSSNNNYNNDSDSIQSDLQLEDGYVYLSPLSLFNLGYEPKSIIMSRTSNFNAEISLLKGVAFPTASQVKISRVKSSASDGHATYSNQLIQFFDQVRIFKEGDLFAVESGENFGNNAIDNPLIFFKVESLQSPGAITTPSDEFDQLFVIDKEKSTMIQEGSSQSLLPAHIQSFHSRGDQQQQECYDFIAYEKEFQKMIELTLPFFHSFEFDFKCTLLLKGASGVGKRTLLRQLSNHLGLHLFEVDCYQLYSFNEAEKELNIKRILERASEATPSLLLLSNFEVLEQSPSTTLNEKKESNISNILKETLQSISDKLLMMETTYQQQQQQPASSSPSSSSKSNRINYPFLIAATVKSTDDMSGKLRSWFKYEIELDAPDESQRSRLLKNMFNSIPINNSVSLKNIAMRTASFLPLNLKNLVERSGMKAMKRVISNVGTISPEEVCNCGISVVNDDISDALADMQGYQSSSLGAPKIPNVKWDDVGGLASVKSEIMDTIQLPLENPHLFSSGIGKRSGILFYGPPGTGKTLLAKAIATECSLNFLSVKGPELINMYIGESEKNIRDIFNKARQAKPCVIFFDELDSLAPSRGNGADSGGVMDRVVSQLLAELDGMQKSSDVFIIGATNRPDLLDPALTIPGRLDRLLYLGISTDKDSQLRIVQALTRKFHLHSDVDLRAVVERCEMNLTGSDFYALCSDALANAIKDMINQLEEKRKKKQTSASNTYGKNSNINYDDEDEDENQQVIVAQQHFLDAVYALVPSVSEDEMAYYHKVQKQFTKQK